MFNRGISGELEAPTQPIIRGAPANNYKNARLTAFGRQLLVWRILELALRVEESAQHPNCLLAIASRCLIACKIELLDPHPAPPVQRYEHEKPGDLLHLGIKKLGRFHRPGHRVTDDRRQDSLGAVGEHSRVALYPDETGRDACRAPLQVLRYYVGLGIRFSRLLTDNRACCRSTRYQKLCRRLGLNHLCTKPYIPHTNGKAERFIQTALREWVYARRYDPSVQQAEHLTPLRHEYNWHRTHASLNYQPPSVSFRL